MLNYKNPRRLWSKTIRCDSGAKYWKWARLTVINQEQVNSRMIALVPEIKVWGNTDRTFMESLMVPLLESIRDGVTVQLKKLSIRFAALSNIEPDLVSSAVLKVEDCTISGFSLSRGQLQASLNYLINAFPYTTSLSFVNPRRSWEVLKRMDLSRPQMEAILTRLAATPDSRLKHLRWCGCIDVRHMDPEVVKAALTKLESVGRLWT